MIARAFLAFLALVAAPAPAQAAAPQPPKPLFASDTPLALTLEAPLTKLFRNRASDDPVAGVLTDDRGNRLPVRVAMRGITRRTAEICPFPPLSIRFDAPPPPTSVFAGLKKEKLVTHCRPASSFDRQTLLEYAAYRMYAALTPKSFGTRLATITYREPGGRVIATRPAFFLEDFDDVAARNGLPKAHGGTRVPIDNLNPQAAATYALFQHMIANHDWSMRAGPAGEDCCHNAKLLGALAPGMAYPVPYDFDFSGFVDAPYAYPPDQLALGSVRDRKYRGYCRHNAELPAAARAFRDRRAAMMAALAAVPGLDPAGRAKATAFVEPFFAEIADDAAVQATVAARCL